MMPSRSTLLTFCMIAAALPGAASALAFPPRGSAAPEIKLQELQGGVVDTSALRGRVLVLLFADLGHEKLAKAGAETMAAIADPRLAGDDITPILIIANSATPGQLEFARSQGALPKLVAHDPERRAYGDYRILVIPSVIVVNAERKVIHAMPAFSARYQAGLTDALLFATGKIDEPQFESTLSAQGAPPSQADLRATRIIQMARQLARRGMPDMAEERYREAIKLSPGNAEARLGLADVLIAQDRLEQAESELKSLADQRPDCVDAALGLIHVRILRGGESLLMAESDLSALPKERAALPRAHYLWGLIHEQRGETKDAAASYRRAAELLLDSSERH
jgi:tetratricopeptide (TPR) repeat protein